MSIKHIANTRSISISPTHGTATQAGLSPVIPIDKRKCEVFWVSALLNELAELQSLHPKAASYPNDSHGNHDVIVTLDVGDPIGVQVTELTYELERNRRAVKDRFVRDARKLIKERDLSVDGQLLVSCLAPFVDDGRFVDPPKPVVLTDAIAAFISGSQRDQHIELDSAGVRFDWIEGGAFYVPSVNGIAINCDLGSLPHTLNMYHSAVSYLYRRKAGCKSPWLLIWSQSFWKDKYWLGDELIEFMRVSFSDSNFERVFFIESMDGEKIFETNLSVHEIKP
jgi:hypothetical protein